MAFFLAAVWASRQSGGRMSLRPVIFISAVSRELRSTRTHVARTLEALGYDVIDQDFAPTDAGDPRGLLRKWVDGTDAVLQIVGRCYGFAPKEADAEFGVCSYTQYEALYARKQGKPVYYIFTEDGHPTDGCGCEPKTLHELQEGYRQQVKGHGDVRYKSDSMDKTELLVRRMNDELAELRKEAQAHQEQLKQGIHSTLQAVTDSRQEIMAGFDGLKQQARRLPTLAFSPSSWPQVSPFHNRGFPDQKNFVGREKLLRAMKKALDAGQDVALTQPVAMHGAGGIGRSRRTRRPLPA